MLTQVELGQSSYACTQKSTAASFQANSDEFDDEVRRLRDADIAFDTFEWEGLELGT